MNETETKQCFDLIQKMAAEPESPDVAKAGQEFHTYLRQKYGNAFAMRVTEMMMDAVAEARMWAAKGMYLESTGECIL